MHLPSILVVFNITLLTWVYLSSCTEFPQRLACFALHGRQQLVCGEFWWRRCGINCRCKSSFVWSKRVWRGAVGNSGTAHALQIRYKVCVKMVGFLSGELGLINGAGQILMYRYIGPSLLCVTEMSSCPQAGRDIGCIRRRRVPCEDELSWFVHR